MTFTEAVDIFVLERVIMTALPLRSLTFAPYNQATDMVFRQVRMAAARSRRKLTSGIPACEASSGPCRAPARSLHAPQQNGYAGLHQPHGRWEINTRRNATVLVLPETNLGSPVRLVHHSSTVHTLSHIPHEAQDVLRRICSCATITGSAAKQQTL